MSLHSPSFRSPSVQPVLCFGGCTIDRFGRTTDDLARLYTSNIGVMQSSIGGAARNVAENLARLGIAVELVTAVGEDLDGRHVLDATASAGVDVSRSLRLPGHRTASYTAVLSGTGELVIGIADMAVLDELAADLVLPSWGETPGSLLFLDANLPQATLATLIARKAGPVAAGAVSVQKCERIRHQLHGIDYLFLNRFEAEALLASGQKLKALASQFAAGLVPNGVVTGGVEGAVAWSGSDIVELRPFPARPQNVNGAGDALAAATLARLALGDDFFTAAEIGMAAAALTVEAETAVRGDIAMEEVLALHAGRDA